MSPCCHCSSIMVAAFCFIIRISLLPVIPIPDSSNHFQSVVIQLWIIKSLMSRMSYDRGERNVITMTKDFAQPLTFKDDTQDEV